MPLFAAFAESLLKLLLWIQLTCTKSFTLWHLGQENGIGAHLEVTVIMRLTLDLYVSHVS